MDSSCDTFIDKRQRKISYLISKTWWKDKAKFILYAGGIFTCYLCFGIAQESITQGKYGIDGKERFTYTQALVFMQCVVNAALAYVLKNQTEDNVPIRMYSVLAFSYLLAMFASNHALQYVAYPAQVLGKSCKPIPVMVFGFLIANKRYHWRKCCYVLMIVSGVALFLYKEKAGNMHQKSTFNLGVGELLLLLSLAMDGTTGAIQDKIRHQYTVKAHNMMYHMNFFSSLYLLIGLLLTSELFSFITFVYNYPELFINLIAFAGTGCMGQYFIFKTVAEFGPLTCAIVTTTRKLFTILCSVILFGNTLTRRQFLATAIVFLGLVLDAIDNKKKKLITAGKHIEDVTNKSKILIGTVYRSGNVTFSPDGNSLISPVGNKITVFDLKSNQANTIAIQSNFNIKIVAIHPRGTHAFLVNDAGQAQYVNLATQTVLYRHHFRARVNDAKFSSDGKRLAVCRTGDVQVFLVFGIENFQLNPFVLIQTHKVTAEKVRRVEWSYDNKLLVAGSEDKQVRIVSAVVSLQNLFLHALAAHKAEVIGSHFCHNSYDVVSVDKRGLANHWTCALKQKDLVKGLCSKDTPENVKKMWYDKTKSVPCMHIICNLINVYIAIFSIQTFPLYFYNFFGHHMMEHLDNAKGVNLTASAYHASTSLLITAFSNGVFLLHEMPHFNLIHSLRVSEAEVSSLAVNNSGDWIAIACGKGTEGQLVVKIWSCRSSFCVVTFTDHSSGISAVCWTSDCKAVLSASLDGTVRAHDLVRYRNFRTLVSPVKTQLGSLAVDSNAELVMASSVEIFNIYVWSLQNGQLLDVLSGHTAPIASISVHGAHMASASWDKTLRVWNVVQSSVETVDLLFEGLDVTYSPSGEILAVLCFDSSISLFETQTLAQLGTIDTALDCIKYRNLRTFTCICFSADGSLLLAAGQSNYICLYSVAERFIVKKLQLTINRSLDGVKMDINRRNFSEFGNMMLIDCSDSEDEQDGKKRIKLPGTRHSDLSERRCRPEMRVNNIKCSPTGRCFAVCSTEGVAVFSLDHRSLFNPFELGVQVTPVTVKNALLEREYSAALEMALQLNQEDIIENVFLSTPVAQIDVVVRSLSIAYAEKLLTWLAQNGNGSLERHIHFWQIWLKSLLMEHGYQIKLNRASNLTSLTSLQQCISDYANHVTKL
ncbi:unnamed protein product [Thelazia callipaeda]|uniref:WD_REPEATS_REGION domain-containing protein n=1 Tax=Thelazia callipaeda TaxID=103827 RepID=A0A0N5CLL9_THECL|nr:unnamed protein product [Thelazia callipaeda]